VRLGGGVSRGRARGLVCGRTSLRLSSRLVMLLWLEPSRMTLVAAPGAAVPKSRGLNCVVRERVAPHVPGCACRASAPSYSGQPQPNGKPRTLTPPAPCRPQDRRVNVVLAPRIRRSSPNPLPPPEIAGRTAAAPVERLAAFSRRLSSSAFTSPVRPASGLPSLRGAARVRLCCPSRVGRAEPGSADGERTRRDRVRCSRPLGYQCLPAHGALAARRHALRVAP
jgi:hypothetical protein